MKITLTLCFGALIAGVLLLANPVQAGAIRTLSGFTTNVYGPNDDGTYPCTSLTASVPPNCTPSPVPIGFSVKFYGNTYSDLYINNNGNVTFDSDLPEFTPFSLTNTLRTIIAPFFADVDTRAGNVVTFGNDVVDGHMAFGVNWINVGYFNRETNRLNSFQLLLIERSDRNPGDFDIEFNYDAVRWEAGDASGGFDGFGGDSAIAGFSDGSGLPGTSFQLAGSAVPSELLDSNPDGLIHGSYNTNLLGRYLFPIINLTNTVLNVPRLSQGDPRWGTNLCDHSAFTVAQKGSALTSLAMALNYSGVPTDPGALNTLLGNDNDFVGTSINWDAATRDASGGTREFHAYRTTEFSFLNQALASGFPIIVGVNLDTNGVPSHFVLVTGSKDGQFLIADPGQANATTLSAYNNVFETRGYVVNSAGNLSGLEIAIDDPADMLLIDPSSRRAGRSPLAGVLEGIPQSAHFCDNQADDLTGLPGNDAAHLITLFQPVQGQYQLYLFGSKQGAYTLSLRSFAQNGTAQTPLTLHGTASAGSITVVTFSLGPGGLTLSASAPLAKIVPLYQFAGGSDGAQPNPGLVVGPDGQFYGTTQSGGVNGYGTVFKVATNGSLTTLYNFGSIVDQFGDALDGSSPGAGLCLGGDGAFYGTTMTGGDNDYGTAFRMTPDGTLSRIYSFGATMDDGAQPNAPMIQGRDGNLYGTTIGDGSYYLGSAFQMTTAGALTTLHAFGSVTGGSGTFLDGAYLYASVIQGSDGNLYGTTETGGTNNQGTIFQLTTAGALTTLYCFGARTDTNGTALDGAAPFAGLSEAGKGNFYGTTRLGGANDYGTIFKFNTNGPLVTLYSFTGPGDGAEPRGSVLSDSAGNFYGTAADGGPVGGGTVFKLTTGGSLAALYSFTGASDGAHPFDGLTQVADGSFYGTASAGGTNGQGTIFRLVITPPPPFIQSLSRSNSSISFAWTAVPNQSYQVQFKTNLTQAAWGNLGVPLVATNSSLSISDPIGNKRQCYYRVELLQ